MKARKVKKLDPAGPLAENAARIVLVRLDELRSFAPGRSSRTRRGPARHADRRQAAALRARGDRFCFGRPAATRPGARQGPPGPPRRDPRLRRDAAARRRAPARLRLADADAVRRARRRRSGPRPELAARAPHRTAYRGLDVLEVYLRARRALLFDRFADLWRESEERGVWRPLIRAADSEIARAEAAPRRRAGGAGPPSASSTRPSGGGCAGGQAGRRGPQPRLAEAEAESLPSRGGRSSARPPPESGGLLSGAGSASAAAPGALQLRR